MNTPATATPLELELGPGARLELERWDHGQSLRHRAVLARSADGWRWLIADRAPDLLLLQAVESRLQAPVRWKRCDPAALAQWLADGEAEFRAVDEWRPDRAATDVPDDSLYELSPARIAAESSPALRLLDGVLHDALKDGASDVHLECQPRGAEIRVRIDGVMQAVRSVDGVALAEQVVSRLKVLAALDIGERRLPQDGRFKLRALGREIDFRLSVMPSVHGEDAVVRVLDRSAVEQQAGALTLESLGFAAGLRQTIVALARAPHGMLLVTGPTGSGKTTTLYAAIQETRSGQEKIITIEDPVEYQLAGVVQIPVNERKGLTFARGLRSILRHDPDRVMVGEIRDTETAQIAVQAALTGHLVFSTVHANSVFDVIGRFMHMGLDLYNVVAALNAVLAQRLLRRICEHCAVAAPPGPELRALLGDRPAHLRHGRGCPHCRGTGYRGRRAVVELLRLDDELRDLIAARAPMSRIKQAARQRGLVPLRQAALDAVGAGWTTYEEIERVAADES